MISTPPRETCNRFETNSLTSVTVGDENPGAEIVGIDLSAIQPQWYVPFYIKTTFICFIAFKHLPGYYSFC